MTSCCWLGGGSPDTAGETVPLELKALVGAPDPAGRDAQRSEEPAPVSVGPVPPRADAGPARCAAHQDWLVEFADPTRLASLRSQLIRSGTPRDIETADQRKESIDDNDATSVARHEHGTGLSRQPGRASRTTANALVSTDPSAPRANSPCVGRRPGGLSSGQDERGRPGMGIASAHLITCARRRGLPTGSER